MAGAVAGAGVQLWSYAMGFGIPMTIVGAGIGGYEAPKLDAPPVYGALAGAVAWGPGIFGGAATYFAGNHFNAKFTDTVEPQIRRMYADVPNVM